MIFLFLIISLINSIYLYWIILTILRIYFISLRKKINEIILFFFIQEISVVLFYLNIRLNTTLAWVFLLFKIGLPPFHFWINNFLKFLNSKIFVYFISVLKLIPLFLFIIIFNKFSIHFILLIIYINVIFYLSGNLKILIFLRSSIRFSYFFLIRFFNKLIFFVGLFFYLFIIGLTVFKTKLNFLLILVFFNLPFFINFLLKFLIINYLITNFLIIFFLIILFLRSLVYFKFILKIFNNFDKNFYLFLIFFVLFCF